MHPIPTSSLDESVRAALVNYTKLTEKDLVNDPLAAKITSDTIYPVPRQHAQTFHDHSELMTCLEAVVGYLQALSTTPALSEVASLQVVSHGHAREWIASATTLTCFVL
jgi:hypothetical protein